VDGIGQIADSISAELKQRLPHQRKTQRGKLALLVATMLDVRSANLMDLAAGLPLEADRTDMRYQWITRFLSNPLVLSDAIMEPFAREVLEQAVAEGQPVVLILDQSKLSERHQVLMLALRYGDRALPLAWRVETTQGAIGFATQKALLEAVAPWMPAGTPVRLMGDRFYGTADLIGWCQERDWGYRLRLKGNLVVFKPALATAGGTGKTTTRACAGEKLFYLEDVDLTGKRARTHIGILHDPGHAEPWIIAMSEKPSYLATLEYAGRWGIEPMFSDFKSRGFGVEDTQIRHADRLDRLLLVMALALYWAVSTGLWDAAHHPTPSEKKLSRSTQKGGPQQDLVVHPRAPAHHQAHAVVLAPSATLGSMPELIDAEVVGGLCHGSILGKSRMFYGHVWSL
jgi:DDE family transposase